MAGHKDSSVTAKRGPVSFAARIRTAAKKLRHDPFGYADLSSTASLSSSAEEMKMRSTVKDFLNRGEIARIAPGEFRYVGRKRDGLEVEKRRVMWRLLTMKRVVSVEDLQEMASVSKEYALEWLRFLVNKEIIKKIPGPRITAPCKWQLIKDVVVMPEDEAQKEKYRKIRREKKETLGRVLDRIQDGVSEARGLMEEI